MYILILCTIIIDSAFSIDIRLKLVRVVGPVHRAESMYNLHKKGGQTGECRPHLQCLSQFFSYEKERDQLSMVL